MVEITPETARMLVDILLMVVSGFLGVYLTYVYAIKKTLRERVLTERVALYRPLVHSLSSLIDLSREDAQFQEKLKDVEIELNRLGRELLLYAPDDVYRHFIKAMSTVKKGVKPKEVIEFMLALRKELIGKTDLTAEEVMEIQLRP